MLISAVAVVDRGLVPVDAYAGCPGKWVAGAAYILGSLMSMKDAPCQVCACSHQSSVFRFSF
jgi:hypothetical protein